MNGGVSPLSVVFLIRSTLTIAVTMPRMYIPNVIASALLMPNHATIAPAQAVNIGSFAPHEKNGMTRIVAVRSFSSASVLALIIAGTEQPKPMIIGINALPERPKRRNILSRMNAIRAIYPLSSRIEKNRNNVRIGGKKESTAARPSKIPLLRSPIAHGAILLSSTSPPSQPKNCPTIRSFHTLLINTPGEANAPSYSVCKIKTPALSGSPASVKSPSSSSVGSLKIAPRYKKSSPNVRWNIANNITTKIGIPQIL